MVFTTKGVVLRQRSIGEEDMILTICTADLGQIEVTARRTKSVKSRLSGAIHVACYSEFVLYQGRHDRYYINSATALSAFFGLREDVEKLSLASYFCELMQLVAPGQEGAGDCLRLLLNTLSFLESGKYPNNFLKAVYELRLLSVSGFMPDLVGCASCGEYTAEEMYFFPVSGKLLCGSCGGKAEGALPLSDSVLQAMRHIVFSPFEKLYGFRLSDRSLKSLTSVTERFVLAQIDHPCKTLSFYHAIRLPEGEMNHETT